MSKPRALLIGSCEELMHAVPHLLNRSGFEVEVITVSLFLKKVNKSVPNYERVSDGELIISKAVEKNLDSFDFIVIADDHTLRNILNSNLTISQKSKLLPVNSVTDFDHIYSKIGLSKILQKNGINTPNFIVASNISQAHQAAENLGYPVMIKIDSSSGGFGVFECNDSDSINSLNPKIFESPVLIQKKIIGQEIDLSGLYRNGQLIHFSYSEIKKVIKNKFGPSSLRLYKQLSHVDEKIFLELKQLGKALGANGFVTISVIISQDDGKNYFIEADMRPNAWADITKFFGDDCAVRIFRWFKRAEALEYPVAPNCNFPDQIIIPHFFRVALWEVIVNRYNIWKYIAREDTKYLAVRLRRSIRKVLKKIKSWLINSIKSVLLIRYFSNQKSESF
jgi:hypothetical protein